VRFHFHTAAAFALAHAAIAADTTVIGLLLPPEEPEGPCIRDGAALAIETVNRSSTNTFKLIVRGREGQWGADGVEAARMVLDDGAVALIAPPDGAATHLVLQVSGRTAVPVATLCPDASVTKTGVPWVVRVPPGTVDQARALFTTLAPRIWVAVVPSGRAGRETVHDLREAAAAVGQRTIVEVVSADLASASRARTVRKALAASPEGILLWVDPALAGEMARRLRSAGFAGILAGPDRLQSDEFIAAAAGAAKDLATPPTPPPGKAHDTFVQNFTQRFGRTPDSTTAAAYDAVMLLVNTARESTDRPLRDRFPPMDTVEGASGELRFDRSGQRVCRPVPLAGPVEVRP
jgi:ABC-type branched-subunit amino acid transport system substrate-binding protein